jgi:uncharacterized membrane protein
MIYLIVGLLLFFLNHSVRIVADGWRSQFIEDKGVLVWRGLYTVVSLVGLGLMIYGFGLSRADPVFLWNPPAWTRTTAIILTLFAFFLFAAANIPHNHIKAKLGHPMFAGTKIWAFAHLIANGRLGDALLFGCFLVWAIVGFSAARKRDRLAGIDYGKGTLMGTALVCIAGTVVYALFAFFLHPLLIGVPIFY